MMEMLRQHFCGHIYILTRRKNTKENMQVFIFIKIPCFQCFLDKSLFIIHGLMSKIRLRQRNMGVYRWGIHALLLPPITVHSILPQILPSSASSFNPILLKAELELILTNQPTPHPGQQLTPAITSTFTSSYTLTTECEH